MREWQSRAHVKHYCRYHIVFVPKYHKKFIYGVLRKDKVIFQDLCRQAGVELVEKHARGNHVYTLWMIPPKFSVSHTVGFLEGKPAI